MSLLKKASVLSACLLATASIANAEQVRLSIGQLDHVTAGAISPISPISSISPIPPIGGGAEAPSPGDPPASTPGPSAPPPVRLTRSVGDGSAMAYVPITPAGSITEIGLRVTPGPNGTSGTAYVRVSSEGGGPITLPGVSATVVHSGK